jgi:hypothetical protein
LALDYLCNFYYSFFTARLKNICFFSETIKIEFARKHFEAIGTDIEFVGSENDVDAFMLRAVSR